MLPFLDYVTEDKSFEKKHPRHEEGSVSPSGHHIGGRFKKKPTISSHKHLLNDTEYKDFIKMFNKCFPKGDVSNVAITNYFNPCYNCVARAFGDTERWWWPDDFMFWPEDCLSYDVNESFNLLLEKVGAKQISREESHYKKGYATIVLFYMDGQVSHASIVTKHDKWVSKLGGTVEIEHSLDDIEHGFYGEASKFYRIPLDKWQTLKDMM